MRWLPSVPSLILALALTACADPEPNGPQDASTATDRVGDAAAARIDAPARADAAGDAARADIVAGSDTAPDTPAPWAKVPADLLDLTNWKLTLPTGSKGKPTEIKQPQLATFQAPPHFHLDVKKTAVLFRAHAGGVTTSGSSYPRSELREMNNGGADKAGWSTTSGTHTMEITQAITHLPVAKPHVVAGQIHDGDDDVIVIRLEGKKLFVDLNGKDGPTLEGAYSLGTPFTVRFVAEAGKIRVYHNGAAKPVIEHDRKATGCYFKAGAYTQSNTSKGDAPAAYGEVSIYALSVSHK